MNRLLKNTILQLIPVVLLATSTYVAWIAWYTFKKNQTLYCNNDSNQRLPTNNNFGAGFTNAKDPQ